MYHQAIDQEACCLSTGSEWKVIPAYLFHMQMEAVRLIQDDTLGKVS